MKILIVIPSVFEANAIFKSVGKKAKLGATANISKNIQAVVSGVGCKASQERLSAKIKEFSPTIVLLFGYCGACNENLKNADFVYETSCQNIAKVFENFGAKKAKIACVAKTANLQKKQGLFEKGFDAVEMESDFFKPEITSANIFFAHLRCVSDTKKSTIPAEIMDLSMDKKTGDINPLKMLSVKAFFKCPTILFNLIHFGIEIAPTQKLFAKKSVDIISALKDFANDIKEPY